MRTLLHNGPSCTWKYRGITCEVVKNRVSCHPLGWHWCAYIYAPDADEGLDVHGGITYRDKHKVGWDYNHCCDHNERHALEKVCRDAEAAVDEYLDG